MLSLKDSLSIFLFCLCLHLRRHLVYTFSCKSQTTFNLLALLPDCDVAAATSSIDVQYPSWNPADCRDIHNVLKFTVELINNSSELLPCNNLSLTVKHDGCSSRGTAAAKTATSLISGLFPPQDKSKVVGILGPACSESARKVVYIANKPEIELVVLHSGGSSIFEHSKNSLDILGSTRPLFDLSLALIEESGWENICILYESSHHYYRNMKDEFIEEVAQNGVNVAITLPVSSASDSFYPLDEIRSSRVRIVFLFTSQEHSKRILCLAYHMGLVYRSYQWVILSHSLSDIIVENSVENMYTYVHSSNTCSKENLLLALEKSYLVVLNTTIAPVANMHLCMQTNTSPDDLTYYRDCVYHHVTQTHWIYSLFDSLWSWAIVLHNLSTKSDSLREAAFNYGNASLANMILEQFFNLSFEGATGLVRFNSSTGFANRHANLYQIRNGTETLFGTRDAGGKINITLPPFSSISDHIKVIERPNAGYIIFFFALACIEVVIVVILHIMTFVHRDTKSVKATSPKLIHLAFVGAYIFVVTLLLNCISWFYDYGPQIEAALCQAIWAWGLPLSFTLTMGIVTVRTWRLYRIFVHYLDPGKLISNPALTAAVLMLVSIDIVIAVIWTSIDPMQFRYLEITVKTGSEHDVLIEPDCYYDNIVWFILIFLYKIALLVTLIVLTVLTRTIPNRKFSLTSTRGFTYSFTTVSIVGFVLYYLILFLRQDPHAEFVILAFLLNTMLVLFVVFIISPPLLPVFCKDKNNT